MTIQEAFRLPPPPKFIDVTRGCRILKTLKRLSNGFTLAEVLVTLGIIGIVAALTLPMVIENYKKQETVSRLKKAYTTMTQALKLSEIDNGEMEYWDLSSCSNGVEFFEKYWKKYFKIAKICYTPGDCNYESNDPFSSLSGGHSNTSLTGQYRTPFITNDGIVYIFSFLQGTGTPDNGIMVDINGSKPPNTYGKDLFTFRRTTDKGIIPNCFDKTENEVKSDCSKNGAGVCCSRRILLDNWEIKYY